MRTELDLDDVLRVAVEATGAATGVSRCYLRLGEPGGAMPIAAEWTAPGFAPIGDAADRLAVSNLAARDRKTVAVGDIHEKSTLTDPTLGGTETLQELDSRAVLATPVLVFERMIGIFALHRPNRAPGRMPRSRSPRPSRANWGLRSTPLSSSRRTRSASNSRQRSSRPPRS